MLSISILVSISTSSLLCQPDGQAPTISQAENLCDLGLSIARLASPNFTLPTALDNTNATELSGLTLSLDASNNDPSVALLEDTIFTYTVTDLVGLTDTCTFMVTVVGKLVKNTGL